MEIVLDRIADLAERERALVQYQDRVGDREYLPGAGWENIFHLAAWTIRLQSHRGMPSCSGCGDRLRPDDVIVASSEERFHVRCHKVCSICRAPIRAGQRRHRVRDREYHAECYERREKVTA